MKKLLVLARLAVLAALVGLGWWWFAQERAFVPSLEQVQQAAQNVTDAIVKNAEKVSAPPPLRALTKSPTSNLTWDGVLTWTNAARRDNGGLKPLAPNAQLNAAAEAKLKDMFAKQYFEHVSPSGVGPGDLADQSGYDYIAVGENLALGNYADDQALVQAWMDSPGHRANILGNYDEIGLAVGRGTYEGETTWLAVQEFGRPVSACQKPDATLKAKIETDKATLTQLAARADALRAELEAIKKPRSRERADTYNAKVDEYNALVQQVHDLNQQINGTVAAYNAQAQAFNACAQE